MMKRFQLARVGLYYWIVLLRIVTRIICVWCKRRAICFAVMDLSWQHLVIMIIFLRVRPYDSLAIGMYAVFIEVVLTVHVQIT